MENLLRGMRNVGDVTALELFGKDGVVCYGVRTSNYNQFSGTFQSHFPQAGLTRADRGTTLAVDEDDWMHLDEDEFALVQTLALDRDSFLPLKIWDDASLQHSGVDPLAGVIGLLSNDSKTTGYSEGGERIGVRVVIRAAPDEWGIASQRKMQRRRDGDDRANRPGGPESGGPSVGMVAGAVGLAGVLGGNWLLYEAGNYPGMAVLNVGAVAAGAVGLGLLRKFGGQENKRQYLDEVLVENKLKSLGFYCEVQLVRIYRNIADENVARSNLMELVNCIRAFDDPAGNRWREGRIRMYSGQRVFQGAREHPFQGGTQELSWISQKEAEATFLSVSEVASLWHLPLGSMDMVSMERSSAGVLPAFLGDLKNAGEDVGPLVGMDSYGNGIRLPESAIRKHAIILGKSGMGKSTLVKHVVGHKLRMKAEGKDNDAIVVIDPHADLVRDLLQMVPASIVDKVRLIDFGRDDRVPGLNLVDPELFSDRDRCVDTIVTTLKGLWESWGNRLADLLRNGLLIIYEFNAHPETLPSEKLTMLDLLRLLEDGVTTGQNRDRKTEASASQLRILRRVQDPRLEEWFHSFISWPPETRAEAVGPVRSRIGAYASGQRTSVVMGQRESTIRLSDVLSEGLVLFVSTAQGTVGKEAAALMGGTMVSLMESELRDQERIPLAERKRCLLVCDEFQTVTGADWEALFAESRKYGCSMMLATQSMARLESPDRRLKEGVLGNVGLMICYQMSADDARIMAAEMDPTRVQENYLINSFPHHCYVRINSETRSYSAFSMKTLPPPAIPESGSDAVAAIIDASEHYTVDIREARKSLDADILGHKAMRNKLPSEVDDGTGGGTLYDRQVKQSAQSVQRPRPSRSGASAVADREGDGPKHKGPGDGGPDDKGIVDEGPGDGGPGKGSLSNGVHDDPAPMEEVDEETGVVFLSGPLAKAGPNGFGDDYVEEEPVAAGVPVNGSSDDRFQEDGPVTASAPVNGTGEEAVHEPEPVVPGAEPVVPGAEPMEVPDSEADVSGDTKVEVGEDIPQSLLDKLQWGPLKGLKASDLRATGLTVSELEHFASLPEDDPVYRVVADKRLGDLRSKTKRQALREVEGLLRKEMDAELEARLAEERVAMRRDVEREVREDIGVSVAAEPGKSSRDPGRVRRPNF